MMEMFHPFHFSVEEVYMNQKKLEAESKQLQVHTGNTL